MTISQAVAASNPNLNLVKSITRYPNGNDVSDHLLVYDELERSHPSTFPTVLVVNVEKRTFISLPFTWLNSYSLSSG
jgi:alpha-mannosidase